MEVKLGKGRWLGRCVGYTCALFQANNVYLGTVWATFSRFGLLDSISAGIDGVGHVRPVLLSKVSGGVGRCASSEGTNCKNGLFSF